MGRYKTYLVNFQILILTVSCVSAPIGVLEEVPGINNKTTLTGTDKTQTEKEEFYPAGVSREYYLSTREEVRVFIDKMNEVIKNQDYDAWITVLSPEYLEEISSVQHLNELSELPAMKTRRITLKTAEDYFFYVVVPSRASSRVDDIEFINLYRVKAFTIYTNKAGEEQRLLLYNLEKNGDLWKIIS